MLELEHKIIINAPVEEVYAFVTNPENATKWRVGLLDAKQLSAGEMNEGTIIEETVNVLGRQLKSKLLITEYNPNKKRGFKISLGPLPIHLTETYSESGAGTELLVSGTTELTGPQRMLARPVLGQVKKQLVQELNNIKKHFET